MAWPAPACEPAGSRRIQSIERMMYALGKSPAICRRGTGERNPERSRFVGLALLIKCFPGDWWSIWRSPERGRGTGCKRRPIVPVGDARETCYSANWPSILDEARMSGAPVLVYGFEYFCRVNFRPSIRGSSSVGLFACAQNAPCRVPVGFDVVGP